LQVDRANFKLIPISSSDFYYLLKFQFIICSSGNSSCSVVVLSLNFSDYFLSLFYFIFLIIIYLAPFFPADISIERKVLAQSFQNPSVSKQSTQGASKVQKAKAKPRVSIVSPSSPQNAIV
jgi:hypothetical protein